MPTGTEKTSNRKIKQIELSSFGYANFSKLLTRIKLAENKAKERKPSNLLVAWFYSFNLYQQELTKCHLTVFLFSLTKRIIIYPFYDKCHF